MLKIRTLTRMRTPFWGVSAVGIALADHLHSLPELGSRQVDGDVADSHFLRRAYHSSAVLNGRVYIDGGELSFYDGTQVTYEYSSTLLSIDLSTDFIPETVAYTSIPKPSGAPNLHGGGIWLDSASNRLYTGFAGIRSSFGDACDIPQGLWSFEPNEDGVTGTWTNLNDTADEYFTTQPRDFFGSVTSGNGTGFFLGGKVLGVNGTQYVVSGLLSYEFATKKATNHTVVGVSTSGYVQLGRMHYVPKFGPAGVIVAAGGQKKPADPPGNNLVSFNPVQVYDPATNTWYEQTTTGSIPKGRKEYCMTGAASSDNTYEILVYAGWDGILGPTSTPWDEAYVLSLPSFTWIKADYQAKHPRHGLTCEHIGGGQVLVIGGVDTTYAGKDDLYESVFNTRDTHPQGLAIFDLGNMSFTKGYVSNRTVYNLAPSVQNFYKNHDRMAHFDYPGLANVFATENFTGAATDDTVAKDSPSGSSYSSSDSESSSTTNKGAIAGGVVGGVAGVALIGMMIYLLLRRRKSRRVRLQQENQGEGANEKAHPVRDDHDASHVEATHAEIPGRVTPRRKPVPSTPQAELSSSQRCELPG